MGGTTRACQGERERERERQRDIEREVERENKRMRGEARRQQQPRSYAGILLQREFVVWQVYIHQNRTKRGSTVL